MFYFASLASIFLFSLAQSSQAAIPPNATEGVLPSLTQIRVSLGTFKSFELAGLDLHLNEKTSFPGNNKFAVECKDYNGIPSIVINNTTAHSYNLDIESSAGFVFINNKAYREKISIIVKKQECLIVNTLEIEKYIAGLINKEMAPNWPKEALRAQAVSSRTYALFQKEQNQSKEYDVESTTQDQVYDGASSETQKSMQAAQSTAGKYLSWSKGPIKAFYHANCGGRTERPEEVWGERYGYFQPVVCPYHEKFENQTNWKSNFSLNTLNHLLKKVSGLVPRNFLRIASVEAGTSNDAKRLKEIVLIDDAGQKATISANKFRAALGNTKIKSTAFTIKNQSTPGSEKLEFEGSGYGHGVGMCQIGARAMAQQGKNYRDILLHYYPLAKITQIK